MAVKKETKKKKILVSNGEGRVYIFCNANNTLITLTDNNGTTIISYTPKLDFNILILSSPEIISGETYTVTIGSTSGTFEAN